ncbi:MULTISPECIES: Asp-tRNA(Asn)/Glu-tRNA(Gln) amidotransferase subunit GatB [unclassified Thiobacillus]|uniref:Asp-tRNA(Asn)/Glu-tRNA(Gln) amidotransferase subunit GatB n=1 Tax=unclassified Thiobacillus TaxID=2646513 RepID=UPI00086F18E8|nr:MULTISPECIES: Asp-tRNA(Asn)/Glu-tRNA(Gln) amidotransferase subunit GatB [unclassified Thiobacillus]MBN8779479.1 Asp-tRNA(Asn)/Glu-tRNA(Gln) amidotransferase subunit GatB [Thiobacillus sp.]ODV03785.1 MAG: aspartyl/glutamyl-tRNA amidotransferase subunit B [Thiobacillus sp. SCN 63-57]
MKWETVIGLEVHTQLATKSKIFSGSSTAFGAAPNTQANAVDIALPGVLPVLNKGAVECAIKFGLAIGATLNRVNVFDRKNYFYPDLPKGYQISQLAKPIVEGGALTIVVPSTSSGQSEERVIHLTRAHMEEDAGKSLHEDFHGMTGIDLNRAGTPLLEIVSEPEMRSSAEAVAYARALHTLVTWIGICDGNMQEGSFRVDANVSVRPVGQTEFGTRREIKNLNSFRFLQQAIDYEVRWQIETLEDGGRIEQATVLFDPDTGETRMMRSKEDAHDYRYFPDPDLLPVKLDEPWIESVRAALPELPAAMQVRFQNDYGVSAYDATVLTGSRALADYFEAAARACGQGKLAANWVMGELSAALNKAELDIAQSPVSAAQLGTLITRIQDGTLSGKLAKQVFEGLWEGAGEVDAIIEARGLKQMSDTGELEKIVDDVLAANPKSVEEFRAGKEKAFNALVGQVMKASRGKANPAQVNELLKGKLQ